MLKGIPLERKSRGLFALSSALAALLLFFAFHGVRWGDLWHALRHGRPDYLCLSLATISVMYLLYGLRWRVLLRADRPISPRTAFYATMVGYLGNNFLPARAGDIIRPVVIGRATGISTGYALATTVSERILETMALVLFSLVASASLAGSPGWLQGATRAMSILAPLGVAALCIAPRMEGRLTALIEWLPLDGTLQVRMIALLRTFLLGMDAFRRPGNALRFAGLTVAIWLLGIVTAMEMAWALSLSLSWQQALLLLVALGLASAAPSTPGYIGIFQFVAVTVLIPFGFSRDQALAYILVFQGITYAAVVTWGLLSLWQLSLIRSHGAREAPPTADTSGVESP